MISIHPMLLFIVNQPCNVRLVLLFQYIPCYCLSFFWNVDGTIVELFQYIPCYCLSQSSQRKQPEKSHFNTSHVTVYRRSSVILRRTPTDFNTSHVTVYRVPFSSHKRQALFQYIPCYCLSSQKVNRTNYHNHFNTSHVTVYHVFRVTDYQAFG